MRVFLLPDRLWSPSRACDSTPGNCTLARRRTYGCWRIPVHGTLFRAPGCSASQLRWASASHQVVPVLVLSLARGEALHPCSFLPTTAALDNAHPPARQLRTRKENRKEKQKTNLTKEPTRRVPYVPCLLLRSSSGRVGPRPLATYFLAVRSPASHRSTVACWCLTSRSFFLTIMRNLHLFYDILYPTSCTLHLETPRFPVLLLFYLSTRYPQTPGCLNDNLPLCKVMPRVR